ncbi:MAG: DUF3455 domain-containing protein [Terriglobales bacterium]|jgi:hypothetical protein
MRLPIDCARGFKHSATIIAAILCGLSAASAQTIPPPKVPDAIQAPASEHIVLLAHATGSQIYTCQATTDGKFSWTLKAPDAELKDEKGKVIGSHFAGPSWKLTDGSKITGKAVAHVDSPDPDSIPWLLVHVIGGSGNGLLLNVTTVQRVNTHHGKPPAEGCDASHLNTESKSPYTADYYFYSSQAAAIHPQTRKRPPQ